MVSHNVFLPFKKRVLCILQLCFGLGAFLWILLYPFLGSIYHYKSQLLVYESVMEQNQIQLSKHERSALNAQYGTIQKAYAQPFFDKIKSAFAFFLAVSPLEWAWVFLAISVPIMLLLKVEGSNQLIWLFPILALGFAYENRTYGGTYISFSDHLPSENYLITRYLEGNIENNSIVEQYSQLKRAWDLYLIEEWAKEQPSESPSERERQSKKGKLLFDLFRLEKTPRLSLEHAFLQKRSLSLLSLYVLWNLLFAIFVRIPEEKQITTARVLT
ncbi:Uncharacterized protein PHSC3_001541 [Chlamydiales bacterium STE3]|nr:Uncharacterized protein PHSC3_001541 [Chlamydiales bacterium STE3]